MRFRRLLVCGACAAVATLAAAAADFDLEETVRRMRADGVPTRSGVADDTGFWLVAIGTASTAGRTTRQALDAAGIEARAELAKAFSVNVQTAAECFFSEDAGGAKEAFRKWSRTDSSELLTGARVMKTFVADGQACAVALLTERGRRDVARLRAAARSDGTVEARGTGATRREAIDAACRSALEQVNGMRAVASSAVVDDGPVKTRIFADVQGLVSAYRILDEREAGGVWSVALVATVDADELQESYGAQLKSIGDPLFLVTGGDAGAVAQMRAYLKEKGFKTAEHPGTADYRVEVRTDFARVTDPASGDGGTQLRLAATCCDKAGVTLFTVENDPRRAVSYSGDAARQAQICVGKAMRQVAQPLHVRIQRAIGDLVNNGRTVRMVFRGVTTREQARFVEALVGAVNDLPGAGSATCSLNEEVCVSTLRLTLKGNPQDFLDLLRRRVPTLPAALSVSTNKIVFEF